MGLRDFTLADVIERNAQLHRDRVAFVADDERISHGEYALRVERLAKGLSGIGLIPGQRLAVLAQNCLAYVELYGAAARLGLILVPLNCRLSPEEIAHVISDTTPRGIIAGAEYLQVIEEMRGRFSFIEHYFSLGASAGSFRAFEDLRRIGAVANVEVAENLSSNSGYAIMHTAAVYGRSRGALLSHAGLLAANLQLAACWGLSTQDVHLAFLPLFHLSGLGLTLAVQHAGGATVLLPRFDAHAVMRAIAYERVTVFTVFPPILATLLDTATEQGGDLSSLRHLTGVEAPDTIRRFESTCPSARFWAAYGQCELSGTVTMAPFRDRPGSAGQPTMVNRVCIVDDSDRLLSAGQSGEIVVRGPTVFNGYWNCDVENVLTFRSDWHHTGDLGHIDEDGYLWYDGRSPAKDLIKSGGEGVYPAEVEQAILNHPAVVDVAVFGVPDSQWGEAIKAVCVCREGWTVTAAELIDFVGSRIARFKRPKHIVFANFLPKDADGRLDRNRLKQDYINA